MIASDHVPKWSGIPTIAPFRMVIHRLVTHECDMWLCSAGEVIERPDNVWAEFSLSSSQGPISGWMCETDRKVECRYDYAEDRIENKSISDRSKSEITICEDTGFSPIEVIVALTKKMHSAVCTTDRKWLFTKLELKQLLKAKDSSDIRIKLDHNFNNRLTKSSLISDANLIGHIYFSLSPQ